MGNCLKCFQSSSAAPTLPTNSSSPNNALHINNANSCQTATSIGNCYDIVGANANDRCAIYDRPRGKWRDYSISSINISSLSLFLHLAETDELLSNRTPLKPENNCDNKRSSFKSLGLLNGSAPTMSEIITTGK